MLIFPLVTFNFNYFSTKVSRLQYPLILKQEVNQRFLKSRFIGNAGFTLLELLLVLTIVAITAASAVIYLIPDSLEHELERESKRLYQLIKLLEDEAVMQSREYGIEIFENGYRFMVFDYETNQWMDISNQNIFKPHRLVEGLYMSLQSRVIESKLSNRADDSDKKSQEEVNVSGENLKEGDPDRIVAPPVWILSSGEMTEFRIEMFKENDRDHIYEILGYETGEVELRSPNHES